MQLGSVRIGPIELRSPAGFQLSTLDEDPTGAAARFVAASPDRTVYHSASYLAFIRRERPHRSDLIFVSRDGTIVVGFPFHPETRSSFTTGYSGLLFSPAGVKPGMKALLAVLAANPQLTGARIYQAVVSAGGSDPLRRAQIDHLLTSSMPRGAVDPIFTRILHLPEGGRSLERVAAFGTLDGSELDDAMLKSYDGDVRNQIRQAVRSKLAIRYYILAGDRADLTKEAYGAYIGSSSCEVRDQRCDAAPASVLARSIEGRDRRGRGRSDRPGDGWRASRRRGDVSRRRRRSDLLERLQHGARPTQARQSARAPCRDQPVPMAQEWGRSFEVGRFAVHESEKQENASRATRRNSVAMWFGCRTSRYVRRP